MPKKAPWITKDVRIVEVMGWLTGACSVVLTGFAYRSSAHRREGPHPLRR